MLPTFKQRGLLLVIIFVVGLMFYQAALIAAPSNGWSGLTLFYNDTPILACLVIVSMLILALFTALLPAATGHPFSGMLVVSGAMLFAAGGGGQVDGWILSADLPFSYLGLIAEFMIWIALLLAGMVVINRSAPRIRGILPGWLVSPTTADSPHAAEGEAIALPYLGAAVGLGVAGLVFAFSEWLMMPLLIRYLVAAAGGVVGGGGLVVGLSEYLKKKSGQSKKPVACGIASIYRELISGGVVLGVGLLLCPIVLRVSDLGQVLCGLMVVFLFGGVVSGYLCPTRRGCGGMIAPLLVGLIGYLVAWGGGFEKATVLSRVFDQYSYDLIKLTLALPAMYTSAGVLGAVAGLAWAQAMRVAEAEAEDEVKAALANAMD